MLLGNNQATDTAFIGKYASTAQLTIGSGIRFSATKYYSGKSARLCNSGTTSVSKRDYGQCDRDYGQHDFGVAVHITLHLWHARHKTADNLLWVKTVTRAPRCDHRRGAPRSFSTSNKGVIS
jgi:hypothetical protein